MQLLTQHYQENYEWQPWPIIHSCLLWGAPHKAEERFHYEEKDEKLIRPDPQIVFFLRCIKSRKRPTRDVGVDIHGLLRNELGAVMKTNNIEVSGMLLALSARGLEKQLFKLPGMEKAEVNYVGCNAIVIYNEMVIGLKELKLRNHECGYHCSGEALLKHVCQVNAN